LIWRISYLIFSIKIRSFSYLRLIDEKEYFNERPISTQQTAWSFISQMRASLPREVGACFWFGNETTNLIREYESCMETPGHPGLQEILNRMDQLNAWDYETRSKSILSKLDITEYHKPLSQLSGGQLKRVALANAQD
jgi:ATPase subunit of ABC transporter with duplicated ATPase domains